VDPVIAPFDAPARELRWSASDLAFSRFEHVIVSPIVIDFVPEEDRSDPVPELIFVSYSNSPGAGGVLRVVSGRAPHDTLMTLPGDGMGPAERSRGRQASLRYDSHPAAGDLDGDGQPEIVATLQEGGAIAWHSDGSVLWTTSFDASEARPNASVSIADLHHDGTPEVIIGRVVLDGQTGNVRWVGSSGRGTNRQGPLSCVADLDGEGSMEIVSGRTVYTADGDTFWERPDGTGGDGFCAVTDIVDASGNPGRDGLPEVVRVNQGDLYVHDGRTGEVHWHRRLPRCRGERGRGGAPTVADFDGDGLMEIGVAGAYCYAVFDDACRGDPLPEGCEGNRLLWTTQTEDNSSSVTSSTVFDFNGDGRAEVVYNDEQYFQVLDGVTGERVFRDGNPSRTRTEQPIVADVDNDGNAEIIFGGNTEAGFAGDALPREERVRGLEIWSSGDDSWVGARPIWNQHTYHITNILDDGTIPVDEVPSWLSASGYRLNRASEDVLSAPDLGVMTGSFDQRECAAGSLEVCAVVTNRGDLRVGPGLAVTFYAGDPERGGTEIGRVETSRPLRARGGEEEVCFEWTSAPAEDTAIFVQVDADDEERECAEDNNVSSIGEGSCPPFG
jgi:hypothetical protein